MHNTVKKEAVRRLRRAAGQIQGLERMVESDKYCIDILHQSLAAKEALSSFEDFVLENHLKTHAREQLKGKGAEKAVKEILAVYKLSKRK